MVRLYQLLTAFIEPLLPLWLFLRKLRGKEEAGRIRERYGIAGLPRPKGTLLWLHAASVGEANSVLLLIEKLRARFPKLQMLLTTGTVTSAALMKTRLPKGVIHQYVPLDTPLFTQRFIRHWKPDIAFWVESEFWPNLVLNARASNCFMIVINARMSPRSFAMWQKYPALITAMLQCFDYIFAQSEEDSERLKKLGAKKIVCEGNIKYDAALLPCDESELLRLKQAIGSRPVWLAASTQPGEEKMAAKAHDLLSAMRPQLLCIIVPRHPGRGEQIGAQLAHFRVALRSKKDPITPQTQIYIADTLGELGLFYRLSGIVFMGGSLVKHGGQNPLEPARLSCAIVTGPHTENFLQIYQEMDALGAVLRVTNAESLAAQMDSLLNQSITTTTLQTLARQWVDTKTGTADHIINRLAPIFSVGES
jgi:3-deoxy-D-manno-octulosonic-acid transferase